MTFQYLTVSCIPATGHVSDISIPDSFMYTYYKSCIMTFQYLTVSCIPAIEYVPNISRYDT